MCSRILLPGGRGLVVTGRTFDWVVPVTTDLWAFPAGTARDGAAAAGSLRWTARHGSVAAVVHGGLVCDGMNDAGLVANLLYLASAEYRPRDAARPAMSLAAWPQYVLDSFATVDEAVAALAADPFDLVEPAVPGGFRAAVHLSISDAHGDSAILEYLDGALVVHHDPSYRVMTNEPRFEQQLALDEYWREIGGAAMLPGTERAADRFVRASYYVDRVREIDDPTDAVAAMLSLVRNVSVPLGPPLGRADAAPSAAPDVAPTLWRTVAEHRDRTYCFEPTSRPNVFWVALDELDVSAGSGVRRLHTDDGPVLAGEVSAGFRPATGFRFLPARAGSGAATSGSR